VSSERLYCLAERFSVQFQARVARVRMYARSGGGIGMKLESMLKRTVRVAPPPKLKVLPTLLRESGVKGAGSVSAQEKQLLPNGSGRPILAERPHSS